MGGRILCVHIKFDANMCELTPMDTGELCDQAGGT